MKLDEKTGTSTTNRAFSDSLMRWWMRVWRSMSLPSTGERRTFGMTEKGRELLSNLAEYENEWVARISQRLSVEELTDLTQALEKVRAV
ncbi:MAG TPA: hypothetical protein VFB12_06695 [Ktedonobacteraceae bacterium]|nr:hypothetical protein [Ktedonobacteraceae bacterium]